MGKNVIAHMKKITLHGVYYQQVKITFPLVSTSKVSLFDLKIFGQENLFSTNDIFEKILQMSCQKKLSYSPSKLSIELIFSKP